MTQGFVFFFWALYATPPVVTAWFKAPRLAGRRRHPGLRHTLVGFALQSAADRFELAWAALAALRRPPNCPVPPPGDGDAAGVASSAWL